MKRLALAVVAISALSAPALAANCAKDYKEFWENMDRARYAKMSAEQIADLSRTALRGYNSCTSGDERFTAPTSSRSSMRLARMRRRPTSSRAAPSTRPAQRSNCWQFSVGVAVGDAHRNLGRST